MRSLYVVKKSVLALAGLSLCLVGAIKAEDSCRRFGAEALRNICGIEGEVKVQIESSDSASSSYCTYKWAAETKRKMKVGRSKMEIEVDQVNKVMIVYPDIGSVSPQGAFEQSIKIYPDPQEVDGVGESAVWSEMRKQLTAVVGGRLYHVHVDHHDSEEDKNIAIQILKAITT